MTDEGAYASVPKSLFHAGQEWVGGVRSVAARHCALGVCPTTQATSSFGLAAFIPSGRQRPSRQPCTFG
jgi:hypothetical protein